MKRAFPVLVALLFNSVVVMAQTYVSGTITGKEIWDPANNPYIVTGNIVGSTGDTLEILPGTEVRFDGNYYIQMSYGHFNAVGTVSDSIIFTSNQVMPAAGDWNMLYMSTSASMNIEYASISFNTYGIWVRPSAAENINIRHCNIRECATNGLYLRDLYSTGTAVIDSNTITNTGAEAVMMQSTNSVLLNDNVITGAGTHGIYLSGTGMDSSNGISKNVITGTGYDAGIYCFGALPEITGNTVTGFYYGIMTSQMINSVTDYTFNVAGNSISGCSYGAYITDYANPVFRNNSIFNNTTSQIAGHANGDIDARNNYWGTAATAEMAAGGNPKDIGDIDDGYDDAAYGMVIYEAWLDTVNGNPVCSSYTGKVLLGDNAFDAKAAYSMDDTVFIQLDDYDLNADAGGIETARVAVTSGTETAPESLVLTETGNSTGIFRGFILIDSSGAALTDGMLQAIKGDDIIVDYVDALTGYNENAGITGSGVCGYTLVSGNLSGRVAWTVQGSPYLVTGDVTVGWQDTLVIEPGVSVCFNVKADDQAGGENSSRAELLVNNGFLIAQGTASDSIIFTSSALAPAVGDWENIYFAGDCDGILEYCRISYANNGIFMDDPWEAPITVRHCRFDNVNQGLYILNGDAPSELLVDSNTVYHPSATGIYVNGTYNIDITGNTVISAGNYGIYFGNVVSGDSAVMISNNVLSGSGTYSGIACWNASPSLYGNVISNFQVGITCRMTTVASDSASEIAFNDIDGTVYGISVQTYANPLIRFNNIRPAAFAQLGASAAHDLEARYNYWDAATTAEMDAGGNPKDITGIYDSYESGSYGTVAYDSWLPEEIVGNIVVYSPASDTATEDSAYSYVAMAAHIDSDPVITFAGLLPWMSVSGDTVYGTPDDPIADTSFMVIATAGGAADTLVVVLSVTGYNDPPVLTSAAADTATELVEFTYVATVVDPDNTPVISFGTIPWWMTQYGDTLCGTAPAGTRGDWPVMVYADDGAIIDSMMLGLVVKDGDGTVPVELSSFTAVASGGYVELAWTTQSEQDNLGYNVFHSDAVDGEFVQVNGALISGAGSTALPQSYTFTDMDVPGGMVYYRLEIVATDGGTGTSDIISVDVVSGITPVLITQDVATASRECMYTLQGTPVHGSGNVSSGIYLLQQGGELIKVFVK